jgi:PAS domain S-box-containing protein
MPALDTPPPVPGQALLQRIDSIASQPVLQVGAQARLLDVARLMATRRASCVPVTDGQGRVLGMVTETRLLGVLRGDLTSDDLALSAAEPMLTVDGAMRCDAAWQLCLQRGASHLGVVDTAQQLVGIVSETDFRLLMHLSVLAGRHLVPSVMQPVARLARPDQTLREAAAVMGLGDDAALVVVDDAGAPVGVLTARDTTRCMAAQSGAADLAVAEVMSRPVLDIGTRASLNEAADRMLEHRVRHLAVMDDGGRLVGLLSGHDLARAMAAGLMDDAFAQDRARHRAILDALPDLVWLKDPDGVYLACNPRFEQLFGAPESQILGRTDHDFVSAELADFFRAKDRAAMDAGAPSTNEELLTFASDGHTELTHTIKTPVRDARGRLLGVLGIGRDITALRRVEDEYRQLFDRSPAPMAVYERATHRLVAVNDAFCALYGWTRDEALQLVVNDLLVPSQQVQADAAVAHNQGLATREWQHRRRDGKVMQVLAQSHDITRDGRACRLVVIADITRAHRNQQREQRRLRLLDSLIRGDALALQLEQLALDHEAAFPGSLCSVLLLDASGRLLQHGAAPSLPDSYNRAIHGLEIGPDRGACGAAAHSGERVVCEDLATDPRWTPYLHLAQAAGLAACWSTPILGAGGQVLGTFAVYRRQPARPDDEELDDAGFGAGLAALAITQQRGAQRLRDSERRLADTLQAVPDPIWLTDRDGSVLLANAAYQHLVDAPAAGDTTATGAAAAHNREVLAAHDARVATSGRAATAEQALQLPPDGRAALFELVGTPLRDAQGQATGVVGAARDITQIRQGAQALADQLQLVDTMFSQTADAIVLLDPDTARFVTFNDAACGGLGYSREAFAGLRPYDIQAALSDTEVARRMAAAMAGETQRFDTRHRHRDGSLQQVAITLRRIEYGGRLLLSAVWQDVTESRRHADSIRRLNQAYAVLSDVNEAIVRQQDGDALLAEVCRIAVQVGGFRLAWIGRRDPTTDVMVVKASAAADGLVPAKELPGWDTAEAALRDDGALVLEHPPEGWHSEATFVISPAGRQRKVLVLQADGPGHFDADTLTLYARLVRDVGHAIESIAAEAARRREQRLREQLMESVAGLFVVISPEGRLLLWNRRFEVLTGSTPEEVRHSHALDYFPPAGRRVLLRQLRRVLSSQGGEVQSEAPLQMRDGRRVPYLLVARRVDLETGAVVVGTGIDISDRVATDRELSLHRRNLEQLVTQRTRELEAANRRLNQEDLRLRAMLSLSQRSGGLDETALWREGIDTLVGLVGGDWGSVQPVDVASGLPGAAVWSTGTPPALPDGLPDGLPGSVAVRALAAVATRALRAGGAVDGALAAGGQRWKALAVPVLDRDRPVLVVCVLRTAVAALRDGTAAPDPADDALPAGNPPPPAPELATALDGPPSAPHDLALAGADLWDIVQRRRTEIALALAKTAADAANQAKSAFLANMSHEIRTPLNAVLGFAHLLQREPLSPRQLEHLGKIADASQHLLQVINDILDFSKIEASKVQLDPTDFALQPCLQRMLAMVADKARTNQVLLQLDAAPHCPALVHGDRLRLEQILLNLLSNAVKFSPHGQVTLQVAPSAPGWLRFDVADTGIGIDAAQLPLLFKPFQQADASTTRRFGGTGLGLAISHRLAQLMGGHISVTSRPGEGSRFRVELPMPAASRLALGAPAAPVPDTAEVQAHGTRALQGLHVLLAEDNPINQEVALELLSAQGAQVDVADDGEVVLEHARAGHYDLVLMDVQMPRMDGLRAAEAIRRLPGWDGVPIIAMTASAFPEDRSDCLAAGMNDVLVKPVRPDALTQTLLRWSRPAAASPTAPPAPLPAPATDLPTAAQHAHLLALRRLLQSHDTEAADHLQRHAAQLQAALGDEGYAALAADVQGYDFGAALAHVDALLADAAR